jgi:hypothetical protein
MRICFDLDETLCTGYPYVVSKPLSGARELLEELRDQGHTLVLHTARGMGRTNNDKEKAVEAIGALTLSQLEKWGFVYDEIYFGKPSADIYIDDKALRMIDYPQVRNHIQTEVASRVALSKKLGKLADILV